MGETIAAALPSLLPSPGSASRCLARTPPPVAYLSQVSFGSNSLHRWDREWEVKKKPGRASSSNSWIEDKKNSGGASSEKIPGRACLSNNWNRDKMIGLSKGRESMSGIGKRPAESAPSVDRYEKKAKPAKPLIETEVPEGKLFSGPTFIVSPDPSELPIPSFFLKGR